MRWQESDPGFLLGWNIFREEEWDSRWEEDPSTFSRCRGMKGWVLCLSEERKEGGKSPSLISCLRLCKLERLEEGELPLKLGEAEHSSLCCHCSSSSGSFLFPVLICIWSPPSGWPKHPTLGCQWCCHLGVQTEPQISSETQH